MIKTDTRIQTIIKVFVKNNNTPLTYKQLFESCNFESEYWGGFMWLVGSLKVQGVLRIKAWERGRGTTKYVQALCCTDDGFKREQFNLGVE